MRKFRILFIAIIAAMMLMGVGYATWGQYLPVTTIGSNSSLNVYFTNESKFDSTPYIDTKLLVIKPSLVSGSSINATINGLYPNAQVKLNAVVYNDSSMPVIMNSVNVLPLLGSTKYLTVCINNQWVSAAKQTDITTSVRIDPKKSATVPVVIALDPSADNASQSDYFSIAIMPSFTTTK